MIPTKLEINNFGPIGEASIDLDAVDLAAIIGQNGTGKSTAFTIAPLWCLFGGTKNGCSPDNLVRMGESEAAVSFEFEHHGEQYKVIRTRSTNGRGKTSLELQKQNSGDWESLSGTTIRETEEKIRDLLGLDEETFTSSSMILQGKSNEFTAKAPGQRKQILAQILGLEIYEKLQEVAKKHGNELDARLQASKERLSAIEDVLAGKHGVQITLESTETQIQSSSVAVSELEKSLTEAETSLIRAQEAQSRIKGLSDRIADLSSRIQKNEESKKALVANLVRLECTLAQEPEILQRVEELASVEKTIRELEPLEARRGALRDDYVKIDQEIKANKNISLEAKSRLTKIREDLAMGDIAREAAKKLPDLKVELETQEALHEDIYTLTRKEEELVQEINKKTHRLDQARARIEADIRACEVQTSKLADARCVDLEAARISPCAFLKGAMEAAQQLPDLKAQLEALIDPEISVLQQEAAQIRSKIEQIPYDSEKVASLKRQIAAFEPLATKAAELSSKEEMATLLETQTKGAEIKIEELEKQLENIEKEGRELALRLEDLPTLQARLESLRPWVERKEQLPAAKERLIWVSQQIEAVAGEISQMTLDVESLRRELENIAATNAREIELDVSKIKKELKDVRQQLQDLHSTRGALIARLEEFKRVEAEQESLLAERAPLAADLTLYQQLSTAFSKNGIPALIIENAIPELERISNEILGEMSQGKHSLRFETQRELKSRAGVAETLDIIVSDWAGSRPYETFSGGEQLRIDFAIRFALAELLSRRAGSKIEWLVVDEGLGSQDREHRELVLEAIKNVANRFKKVFVITHIEEAQEAFPNQIRFERSDSGVEVEVV